MYPIQFAASTRTEQYIDRDAALFPSCGQHTTVIYRSSGVHDAILLQHTHLPKTPLSITRAVFMYSLLWPQITLQSGEAQNMSNSIKHNNQIISKLMHQKRQQLFCKYRNMSVLF